MTIHAWKHVWIVEPGKAPLYGNFVIQEETILGSGDVDIPEGAVVHEGKGRWILPGFVNTHGHAAASLMRGAGDDMMLQDWLEQVMWPREKQMNEHHAAAGQDLALVEMLKTGTTTFLDMYHLGVRRLAEKTAEIGMKAVIGRGMISFGSDSANQAKLEETRSLIKDFHGYDNRLRVCVAPHAPYTCPPAFLQQASELAHTEGVLLHTHCAETTQEVRQHIKSYGLHPVDHLYQLGLFDNELLLAHAVHVQDSHLELMAAHRTAVAVNTVSNAKLGSGIPPYVKMKEKGVRTGLGTDSAASNNNLSMIEEMRFTAMLPKAYEQNPAATHAGSVWQDATVHGADILGFPGSGSLAPGSPADFLIADPQQSFSVPFSPEKAASHLVYSMQSDAVKSVWISGRELMRERELLTLDEEKVLYEADKSAAGLL